MTSVIARAGDAERPAGDAEMRMAAATASRSNPGADFRAKTMLPQSQRGSRALRALIEPRAAGFNEQAIIPAGN
jgi:hypothetical protein